jgi:POT family proton-dependent oligopeptide transporter
MKYRTSPEKTSGLPSGISYIIGNEAAERFSFYGMRSVLLAYMTIYLVQPNGESQAFSEKEAEAWVHLFVGSAYFFPLIGGHCGGRFLGEVPYYSFLVSFLLPGPWVPRSDGNRGGYQDMVAGRLIPDCSGFRRYQALRVFSCGRSVQSTLNNHLLSRVFGWFYFSINMGAFLSGLLTPFLLQATCERGNLGCLDLSIC